MKPLITTLLTPLLITPLLIIPLGLILVSAAHGDTLETDHGDTISGTVESLEHGTIVFKSPMSPQALQIKASSLKHLTFPHTNKSGPKHSEVLTLINGDTLPCHVTSIDENHLSLTTGYAGSLNVDRSKIRSLRFGIISEEILFIGNEPPETWTHMEGDWTMTDDQAYEGKGHLAQQLPLPDKVRYQYDLSWQSSPNFAFRFFAENNSAASKQNAYELIFNSEGMEIRRYPDNTQSALRVISLSPADIQQGQKQKKSINIDLRADKSEGLISLYLDSTFIGTWHDTVRPTNGNYTIFHNRSDQKTNCVISNIAITSRIGSINSRFYDKDATLAKTDILTDSQGNNIPGKLTEIQSDDTNKRVVVFEEKHEQDSLEEASLQVPEHRISTLLFAKEENPAPSAGFSHMLHLNNGGKLKINKPTITADQLTATHPILGPLNVSRTSIESLSKGNTEPAKQ
jgi:hypothetical protein